MAAKLWYPLAGLALGLTMLLARAAPIPILLVGDDSNPPYSYADQHGAAAGIYADMLRRLAQELPDYAIELRPLPWRRALHEVQHGQADGIFPPYRKPELRPWMRYSQPLLTETTVVLCRAAIAKRLHHAAWPAGFTDLRFGNNAGFLLPGKAFFDLVAQGRIALTEAKSTEQNLRMLNADRIDCYANERTALRSEMRRLKLDPARFAELAVIGTESGYVGYAADTGNAARERFIQQLDQAIKRLRATGRLAPTP